MNPYQLSKNYYQLWDLVCRPGSPEIVCFVDFDFRDGSLVKRDVCICKRVIGGTILFSVRGVCYGDAPFTTKWPTDRNWQWQKDRFMNECRRMNVEWIIPQQTEVIA